MKSSVLKNKFVVLYEQEADAVFRFCLMRTSDDEIAMDISQEVFLRFWRVLAKGEDVKNDRALLFSIARNLIIDWYRKKKTLSLDVVYENGETEGASMEVLDEDMDVFAEVEAMHLLAKISELNPIYGEALYLRFVEGLNPKDISEVIGVSANVVSVRINRGIESLKEVMGYDENKKVDKKRK